MTDSMIISTRNAMRCVPEDDDDDRLNHWPLGELNKFQVIFKLIAVVDGMNISCEIAFKWLSLDLTDD